MSLNAINGNEINGVSFPGSETGLSLVQLVGQVTIDASMSFFTLRLTAGATTNATASSPLTQTKARFNIGASTEAFAVSSAGVVSKIKFDPVDQSATATVSATAIRRFRLGAQTSGLASASAQGVYSRVPRSAIVDAKITSSVIPFRLEIAGAATDASASTSADIRVKTRRSANTTATASSTAHTTARFRLGASASGVSTGTVATRRKIALGASATATGFGQNASFRFRRGLTLDSQLAQALAQSITPRFKISVGGAQVSATAPGSALAGLKMRFGATTIATVSYAIAAADYAARTPAPSERTMVLPLSSRRMEVTS
jgi:hypothetical protein